MSTVKISQLPQFSTINANTANTLFVGVDVPTDTTFQMTAHVIAQGLYSNEILNVGGNPVLFSNTIAQFAGSDPLFSQINNQNFNANGSADYIATADMGTNANNYIDLGINNSQFNGGAAFSSMKPLDGYLYVHGSYDSSSDGNLIIGTASTGANVYFIAGNTTAQNIIMTLTKSGLVLNTQSSIIFSDGSKQNTAVSSVYVQAAFNQANTANTLGQNVLVYASAAYNQANLTAGGLIASNANVGLLQTYSNQANANIGLLQSYSNQANANIAILFAVDAYQNTIDQIQTANIAAAFNLANTSVQNTAVIQLNTVTANTLTTSNGIINTVRVNGVSPLTINFTTDTIVRANLSANFTLTPASFVAGKTIDVWLTNTASGGGSAKTITHGVSALNSTVGATTFSLTGTQSALLKYMCADGTLANTFVAITYQ